MPSGVLFLFILDYCHDCEVVTLPAFYLYVRPHPQRPHGKQSAAHWASYHLSLHRRQAGRAVCPIIEHPARHTQHCRSQ